VGFERTTYYVVNETDGQVELCVNVTRPENQNIGDVTFNLTVETRDGTAGMSNKMNAGQFTKVITVGSTYTHIHIHPILCWLK